MTGINESYSAINILTYMLKITVLNIFINEERGISNRCGAAAARDITQTVFCRDVNLSPLIPNCIQYWYHEQRISQYVVDYKFPWCLVILTDIFKLNLFTNLMRLLSFQVTEEDTILSMTPILSIRTISIRFMEEFNNE